MEISFRPGGLAPSSYEVERVYQGTKEQNAVLISSTELLERIKIGIFEGEIPYGSSIISIYDQNGFKHESGFTNRGDIINSEVSLISPISDIILMKKNYPKDILRERTPICGNCSWSSAEVCHCKESDRIDTFVSDYEPACLHFSDAYADYVKEKEFIRVKRKTKR